MNGVVASVLNKVLGDWIENLNSDNLNLSIFSGDLLLKDLSIKPSAFDNLGLPFRLLYGYIGKISAKIPWKSLGKSPLRIQLEAIYICISPIPTENWKEDFEIARYYSNKIVKLKQLNAISETKITPKTPGFTQKLIGKIVHNLQIDIKNIYIRYSDNISNNTPFAFGLAINEIKAITCNKQWNEEFIKESDIMYKLVQINGFRVYMDYNIFVKKEGRDLAAKEFVEEIRHNYILPHSFLKLQAVVNKKVNDFSIPQIQLEVETSKFSLKIDTVQVAYLSKTGKFFSLFTKFQKGIVGNIKEESFTEDEAENYKKAYLESKCLVKNKKKQEKVFSILEGIEKNKIWDEIIQQRKIADKELELEKQEAAVQEELKTTSKSSSKFLGIFSRKDNTNDKEKKAQIEKLQKQIKKINEERENLTKEFENLVSDVETSLEFPSDFIRFVFKFYIKELSLMIVQEKTEFMAYRVKRPKCEIKIAPSFYVCKAGISGSELLDLQDSTVFPYIIKSSGYKFELTNKGGLSISLSSGDLEIIVKLRTILKTVNAIKEATANTINYSQYTHNANAKTKKYIAQGEKYLSQVMKNGIKTSLKLNIHLKAPKIIIPHDPENTQTGLLVVDFGSIILTSSPEKIYDNLYDKYTFILQNFEIYALNIKTESEVPNCLLKPITIDIILYNSLTQNLEVPALMVEIVFHYISIILEDITIMFLLNLKKSILNELSDFSKPQPIDPELLKVKKDIKIGLMMKFAFKIEKIDITIIYNSISLATTEIIDIGIGILIKETKNVDIDFHIGFIELRDNRKRIKINKIICNPIFQTKDLEFTENNDELKQFSGNILYDGTVSIEVFLNDLRITVPAEFCGQVLNFVKVVTGGSDLIVKALDKKRKKKHEEISPKISSGSIKLKAQLSNITILLPLDAKKLGKRVAMFNVSISVRFSSKKIVENNVYLTYNDSAAVKFKKIESIIGLFTDNTVKGTHQKTENLLMPTKFDLKYKKTLKNTILSSSITLTLGEIAFDIGFRDLDFFKKLGQTWKSLNISSPPPKTDKKPPSTLLNLSLTSSSLSLKFTDDTHIKPVSLVFACINKLNLSLNLNGNEISAKIYSKLYAQCYSIKDLQHITEALIEKWTFEAEFIKKGQEILYDFSLNSDKFLNVNISENMLGTLGRLIKKFKLDPEFWANEIKDERDEDCAKIINQLGEEVSIIDPYEGIFDVKNGDSFIISNLADNDKNFTSYFILKRSKNDRVKVEVTGFTNEFIIKTKKNTINCYLRLQEHTEEVTLILTTETEFLNLTNKSFHLSSGKNKLKIRPSQKISMPLSFYDEEVQILTDSGPVVISNTISISGENYYIEQLHMLDENGFKHLIYVFVPSFYIQNLLPCPLIISHQPMNSINITILPGEIKELPVNPKALGKIQMSLNLETLIQTSWVDLTTSISKILLPSNYNKIILETLDYDLFSKLPHLTPVTKSINCKLFHVYSRYIVINKTNLNLELKKNLQVKGSSMCFVRARKDKIKFRGVIENKYTGFSKDINVKTVGVSGCISLESNKALPVQEILLGVRILSSPIPLVKTKLIIVSPRYLLANKTIKDLYIRQVFDGKPGKIITKIEGENVVYQLENSGASKNVQVSTNGNLWSNSFDIEEITEFQVALESLEEERVGNIKGKRKKNKGKDKSTEEEKWFLPNGDNDYRTFIQVSISSEDQSIISIIFKDPSHSEFAIVNNTEFPLTLCREKYTYVLNPGKEIPWADSTSVTIKKDNQEVTYSLLKVKRKKKRIYEISAEVRIIGVTRRLELGKINNIQEKNQWESSSQIKLTLSGIGISLFTRDPKELLFFSISNILLHIKSFEGNGHKKLKSDIKISKIQLDNMDKEDTQYAVILLGKDDEDTPFFQSKLTKLSTESFTRFPWAEVNFQELQVQLNQELIYKIIDFLSKIKEEFTDQTEYIPIPNKTIIESFPILNPSLTQTKSNLISSMKIYMNYLRLYPLKIIVSFKVPPKKFEFQLDPRQAFGAKSAAVGLVSSFVNITNSDLVFTQILITDSFQTLTKLIKTLIQNYTQQGIKQVYKLLGSSDMLGNPIRLMNKLGTGVFEFISEPAKGALKGPKEFKDGIQKGAHSLVSNIVGGGLQSVSSITGGLYNVVSKAKGEENKVSNEENIVGSITGGIKDIGKGVSGIFSKPVAGIKNEGGSGFFKGIGTGLMGAVTAPLSAGLKISSGVTNNVSNAVLEEKPELLRVRDPKVLKEK
ncbi:hypothetical protein SteCoe_1454 [Stentor coeruleus]|uniref:Chorein N-terminal domain-containing protein n=1 Tax=Stentor coeruleus TaxID=5963 RepID=A0A1R2D201_9CILI|nr:hypothetical protein SteCoe_1454 [Stentor coeruleus]